MIFNLSKNELFLILSESYISSVIFAIFITIMMMYVIFQIETENLLYFIIKSLELYIEPQEWDVLVNNSYFRDLYENTKNKMNERNKEIEKPKYDLYIIQIILLICFIFILGIINFLIIKFYLEYEFSKINWKNILFIIGFNSILVILFELLFIYLCLGNYAFIRINNILKKFLGLAINNE